MLNNRSREAVGGLMPEREKSIQIESSLERLDGRHELFDIGLMGDGKPTLVAFFDVDKTLVRFRSIYRDAIAEVFPEESDKDRLFEIYEAGFQLGSSRAEQIRLQGIYREGKSDWIDAELFESSYFDSHREEINHPGTQLYDRATALLREFDEAASQGIIKEYQGDPTVFDKVKIEPTYHLARIYKRLGIPMVCMSANPGKFIRSVCKYLDLSEFFIEAASDWDVDGDKEHKMQWLVGQLEHKGLPIPYDRLEIVGDSIKGDIASGLRFKELIGRGGSDKPVDVRGLLVVDSDEAIQQVKKKIAHDPELQELVRSFDVRTFELHRVTYSPQGTPNLGSLYRKDFSRQLDS